jgi:hypothetical protein
MIALTRAFNFRALQGSENILIIESKKLTSVEILYFIRI